MTLSLSAFDCKRMSALSFIDITDDSDKRKRSVSGSHVVGTNENVGWEGRSDNWYVQVWFSEM